MLQVSRTEREGEGRGAAEKTRGRKTDRWKKRERTRGWPREFEESVKGFDCSREEGKRGEKMRQK